MVIIHIFIVLVAITVSRARIPHDRINTQLIGISSPTFEFELLNSLQTTKNFFARQEVVIAADVLAKVGGLVPVVGSAAAAIPMLRKALEKESDWKEPLSQTISDGTHRAIVENNARFIDASMKAVYLNFVFLEKDFEAQSMTAIVHIIHTELYKIVSIFANVDSIYRKYALVAAPQLLALSSFVALFSVIESALDTSLAENTLLSCKLSETILEYRPLIVYDRVKKIKSNSGFMSDVLLTYQNLNINSHKFEEHLSDIYGYRRWDGYVDCEYKDGEGPHSPNEYFTDDNHEYFAYRRYYCNTGYFNAENSKICDNLIVQCFFSYTELIRKRIEQVFNNSIDVVNQSCLKSIHDRTRGPTGFGWLTVTVSEFAAFFRKKDGGSCDANIPVVSQFTFACDVYIKISINGNEVYKSKVYENTFYLRPYVTFRSSKILKTHSITIELWDDDSSTIFSSNDDLILRWTTNIDYLSKNGYNFFKSSTNGIENISRWEIIVNNSFDYTSNAIGTVSQWVDEYNAD